MADEPNQPTLPLEPATAPAPAAAAPAAETAAAPAPAPSPEPAAAAAAAPAVEPAPAAKPELTSDVPSMLEGLGKKDEPAKPAEAAKAAVAKPDDAKPAEKAKEAAKPVEPAKEPAKEAVKPGEPAKPAAEAKKEPTAEEKAALEAKAANDKIEADKVAAAKAEADRVDIAKVASELKFELPEQLKTTKTDDPTYTGFVGAIAEATKNPQVAGQNLLNLHADAMQAYADQVLANQHKAFNDTRAGWRKDIMADEEIGGAGHQTATQAIARMRDFLTPKELMEPRTWPDGSARPSQLDEFLRTTGAGDHPVFMKILHRAARYFDEPGLPPDNPKPPPDNGKAPGSRRSVIYDHPRSNPNRQQ